MKIRKQISVIVIIFAGLMIPAIQSCQKYPDGPFISFRTRTERVANTWKVDNYKKNGNDYTSLMGGYTETYSKDGNYSYSWGNLSGTGKWAFQNSDKEIRLNGINNQSSQTLVILKLEKKQFWYYYMDGNDKKEFHMIQN
ncbi:MAG TPA: hypothetical protein VNZ49_09705 [Bacteroidia bacterium]|jgi:hypothetical protein|nr:hypothetical protein [Bacteroidia bacterium]